MNKQELLETLLYEEFTPRMAGINAPIPALIHQQDPARPEFKGLSNEFVEKLVRAVKSLKEEELRVFLYRLEEENLLKQ